MLKTLSINNDRYYSQNKKRKIKPNNSNNPNNIYTLQINNMSNNGIKPIKLIQRNNIFDDEEKEGKEYPFKYIEDNSYINKNIKNTNSPYKTINITNNTKKKYNTIEINKNVSTKNKRNRNSTNNFNKDKDNIINIDKYLAHNEKKFRRNVSQRIITNKKIKNKLIDNISLLNNKINNNYTDLQKLKYNCYDNNKSIIETLFNDKRIRLLNRNNNKKIYDIKNDIINIKNKIDEFKGKTNIYVNNYNMINIEVNNLKNQCKILPEEINNLEMENKKLANKQIILHAIIQKIKLKIFELDRNKKNIERNLNQVNMLYE